MVQNGDTLGAVPHRQLEHHAWPIPDRDTDQSSDAGFGHDGRTLG